jgi:hypothetical protein
MPRNRVIYQSEALWVGPTPATGAQHSLGDTNLGRAGTGVQNADGHWDCLRQLHRLQTCNYSFNIDRTDVNQFGELAAIDRVSLDTPTVTLDFSYLLANFHNEQALGLITDGSSTAIRRLIDKREDDKNYFIRTSNEGIDAAEDATNSGSVIALGNGFLSSYSTEASVGAFPTVTCNVEALNMAFVNDVSGDSPAIDPQHGTRMTDVDFFIPTATGSSDSGDLNISVLRPGDITFEFKKRVSEGTHPGDDVLELGTDVYASPGATLGDGNDASHAKIQSYTISVDLPREPILKLGSRYAYTREITFPITATCSLEALVSDLNAGSLNDLINCDESYDIQINLLRPTNCAGANKSQIFAQYRLKNCKINSQSFSSDIGSNKSVSFEFSAQVGGPNQSNMGLFMSGIAPGQLDLLEDASVLQ